MPAVSRHADHRSRRARFRCRALALGAGGSPGWRGFTLVELVLSMAIMSMLIAGLASAILIATQALPSNDNPAHATVEGAEIADLIAEELQSALWVRERTATSVEFAVPDRDANGSAERVRYAWSGVAGDPLTRQYNGGSVVDVVGSVQEFNLVYDLRAVAEQYPGVAVESAEVLWSAYTGANTLADFSIDVNNWLGQHFQPSLDPSAVTWGVTRVLFEAEVRDQTDGQTLVQLRPADPDNLPRAMVLEQHTMYESDLTASYAWQEFNFSDVCGLPPDEGLCLVLQFATADKHSANVQRENGSGFGLLETADAGASWAYREANTLRHYIYGTYALPGSPQTATRWYMTGVRITLRTGDEPTSRIVTAVQTLNTPELLAGWWETSFDADPTLDRNGDGSADWVVRAGGVFDAGSLTSGVWSANATLDTYPDHDFTGLTTAEVRFRNTSIGGSGAVFWINADWSGSTCAPVVAFLQLQADATQTLTVCRMADAATKIRMLTVPGLSSELIKLRLLIDPDLDTVNIKVDKIDHGTFAYSTITPSSDDRFASVFASGSEAEFDYVSVRVGE
jgi:prepilin-type N-terminal cleavage/methylation domain-containing protein